MKRRRNQQLGPVGSPPSDNESGNAYDSSREQDRFLPVANVSRIMKKALPTNAKISKEAKGMVQECVSEFISFITGEASEKCQREKRKIVNGDDLLWAMTTLGFENYVAPLKVYLNKYRETEGAKNSVARLGDQSLADEGEMKNSSSDPGATDVHPMTSNASLPGFNSGFYSVTGYEEHYRTGAFDMSGINGGGEANGGSALPSHLHGYQ